MESSGPLAEKPPLRRKGRRRHGARPSAAGRASLRRCNSSGGGGGVGGLDDEGGNSSGGSASPTETPGGSQQAAVACGRYPLRRGSSFTFLTPGPHWDFTLKRKRREKDDDVVSICSLDLKDRALLKVTYKIKIPNKKQIGEILMEHSLAD